MQQLSFKHHAFILSILLLFSLIVRLFLFSGFVLGDDPAYASFVSHILKGSYPSVESRVIFACRPLVLYPVACSIYLFGWQEWSFVLPVLISSLINISIVYSAGNMLCGPLAAVLAALAYATFPLDVVHSTTLSNDILLSMLVWGGGLLMLFAFADRHRKQNLFFSVLSGFIVGAAVAVKLNAAIAPLLFLGAGIIAVQGKDIQKKYTILIVWAFGWVCANILLCLFFYHINGDFFAHYHAEMRFNIEFNPSNYSPSISNLIQYLLLYPRWILGLAREGPYGYSAPPYGYFFIAFLLCVPFALFKRFKSIRLPGLCVLFYLLVMEFTPLKIFPHYVPIHRLSRFLHIASIPATVVIGIVFAHCIMVKSRTVKSILVMIFLAIIGSSLYWSWVKASFYQDCARDQRWAWQQIKNAAVENIVTDEEMGYYFLFRSGSMLNMRILIFDKAPKILPADSLIIAGGARRPDMYPFYAADWEKGLDQKNMLLIAEAPSPIKPWRATKLKIYRTRQDIRDQKPDGRNIY
jgi:4-amino-4-deoxy-L-arabinose transferase-like glycosyltransferase